MCNKVKMKPTDFMYLNFTYTLQTWNPGLPLPRLRHLRPSRAFEPLRNLLPYCVLTPLRNLFSPSAATNTYMLRVPTQTNQQPNEQEHAKSKCCLGGRFSDNDTSFQFQKHMSEIGWWKTTWPMAWDSVEQWLF